MDILIEYTISIDLGADSLLLHSHHRSMAMKKAIMAIIKDSVTRNRRIHSHVGDDPDKSDTRDTYNRNYKSKVLLDEILENIGMLVDARISKGKYAVQVIPTFVHDEEKFCKYEKGELQSVYTIEDAGRYTKEDWKAFDDMKANYRKIGRKRWNIYCNTKLGDYGYAIDNLQNGIILSEKSIALLLSSRSSEDKQVM